MIWGLLTSAAGTLLMVLSLAEICHSYPMSGGQYDWACESASGRG
jgi:amino acid transporter